MVDVHIFKVTLAINQVDVMMTEQTAGRLYSASNIKLALGQINFFPSIDCHSYPSLLCWVLLVF